MSDTPPFLAMIADDLSGACDSGIEFLGRLDPVTIVVDSESSPASVPSGGLVIWNTESRALDLTEACLRAERAAQRASALSPQVILKKGDSAFRGHFGPELDAVMGALPGRLTCVAPAIPDGGRTTLEGIQRIDGVPIAETFYRQDPLHPVLDSSAIAAVERGSGRKAGLIDLQTVRRLGAGGRLREMVQEGIDVGVVDSETQEDLAACVESLLRLGKPLLLVGGQGLARALAARAGSRQGERKAPRAEPHPPRPPSPHSVEGGKLRTALAIEPAKGPILVCCGTLHPRSRAQMAHLARHFGVPTLAFGQTLGDVVPRVQEAAEIARQCAGIAGQSPVVLLASASETGRDPRWIEEGLAEAVKQAFERLPWGGLVLTGGSTAYAVCRRLGIARLVARSRPAPLVCLAEAPDLGGLPVCIKGGSMGDEDVFQRVIECMRSGARGEETQ